MKFRPLAAALILLTACSYDVVKSHETNLPRPQGSPDLNFNKVYQTALATNCTSCHAGFSSYETVFSLRDQIASRVQSRDMPRGRVMPDDQRALLLEWLAAGAPRGPAGSDPAPTPQPPSTPCPDDDGHRSHLSHGNENCEPEKHLED